MNEIIKDFSRNKVNHLYPSLLTLVSQTLKWEVSHNRPALPHIWDFKKNLVGNPFANSDCISKVKIIKQKEIAEVI